MVKYECPKCGADTSLYIYRGGVASCLRCREGKPTDKPTIKTVSTKTREHDRDEVFEIRNHGDSTTYRIDEDGNVHVSPTTEREHDPDWCVCGDADCKGWQRVIKAHKAYGKAMGRSIASAYDDVALHHADYLPEDECSL